MKGSQVRLSILLLLSVIATGCSNLSKQPTFSDTDLNSWHAKGRFSYKSEQVTESGNFDWRQQGNEYQLRLYGPLGMGTVRISGNPNLVRIQNRNQDISSDQPLSLMYRMTGLDIPLNSLPKWLTGQPAGDAATEVKTDANNLLMQFNERGWQLTYPEYQQLASLPMPVPTELRANKDQVELRLLIKSFEPL